MEIVVIIVGLAVVGYFITKQTAAQPANDISPISTPTSYTTSTPAPLVQQITSSVGTNSIPSNNPSNPQVPPVTLGPVAPHLPVVSWHSSPTRLVGAPARPVSLNRLA